MHAYLAILTSYPRFTLCICNTFGWTDSYYTQMRTPHYKNGWVISTLIRLPQLQFCKLVSHACPNTAAIHSSCNIYLLLYIQSKNSFVIAYPECNIHVASYVLLHDCAR